MTTSVPPVTVAAIQAMPVFLDRTATTEKACRLIREAGQNGAEFIVFPEGFIPTHPVWFHHHVTTGSVSNRFSVELFENAVQIPGPETDALSVAARDAGAFVVMGVCEKLSGTLGTMYNTQIFISPDGVVLGKHQKFMPTVGERLVHTGGHGDTFQTYPSRFGNVSALVCGENSNPLAIAALTAEHTRIHGMSWPHYFALTADPMREHVGVISQAFAIMSNSFVVSSCAVIDEATIEQLQMSPEDAEVLRDPRYTGGSVIVAPHGKVLAGPMGNEEGILYAECDFGVTVRAKLRQDLAGHYQRPDIFQLHVNRHAPRARTDLGSVPAPVSVEGHPPPVQDSQEVVA